jgi:hypothetical protein
VGNYISYDRNQAQAYARKIRKQQERKQRAEEERRIWNELVEAEIRAGRERAAATAANGKRLRALKAESFRIIPPHQQSHAGDDRQVPEQKERQHWGKAKRWEEEVREALNALVAKGKVVRLDGDYYASIHGIAVSSCAKPAVDAAANGLDDFLKERDLERAALAKKGPAVGGTPQ